MGSLTVKQVIGLAKGQPIRKSDGKGLYFVVPEFGDPYWALRYTGNGKRKQMTLGTYADFSLADARTEAEIQKRNLRQGLDPLVAKERQKWQNVHTVTELFEDWYDTDLSIRLKHPKIPKRIFNNEIKPVIGNMRIDDVNARDVRQVIAEVKAKNKPTIANDTLMYMKQLFNHAIKLDLTSHNPASAFRVTDAGGVEQSRSRSLSLEELKQVFACFREHNDQFVRENYLAAALLVTLGVRKGELVAAKWEEFDFDAALWHLPKDRAKTGVPITVPLPNIAIEWLKELQIRACGSEYVFPNRRASKRNAHISPDTLNSAIQKLFKENKMPVNHFTVHDLRRTCRSLLASEGIPGHVAERCLNHKLKGVEGIYDRYDYLEERREALDKIALLIAPIIFTKG